MLTAADDSRALGFGAFLAFPTVQCRPVSMKMYVRYFDAQMANMEKAGKYFSNSPAVVVPVDSFP
jgi:hypothetical protein